ncbi:MAG TPA: flagellin [Tepidisphaeraceae bacterium]|nr:flagellin [Tepidisphaeraceae bacterium]
MSRINTNIASLQGINRLTRNNADLAMRLQRLSTGLRINTGKDAPAGLIASENLRSEIAGINQAIDNSNRAMNVINTAEGALGEVAALLLEVQSLTSQAANTGALSKEEIAANQIQVDSILNSINRSANTTQFNGVKLLNGSLDYTTSGVVASNFANMQINAALLPDNAAVNVVIAVTQSAQAATIGYTGGDLSATNAVTIQVSGNLGVQQLAFAGGATIAEMVTAINSVKNATGVSAVDSAGDLGLYSTSFGSKQYVSLSTIAGTFVPTAAKTYGRDASVTVNGAAAQADGLNVNYRSSYLDIQLDIQQAFNTVGNDNFYITGGGAKFALGSKVTEADKASIGIKSVSTGSLGDQTTGYLTTLGSGGVNSLSSGNLTTAQRIIDKAIKQVSTLRGRLGAFQKEILESNVNSLSVALENVTASESAIRDADFATETAALTRAQILVQANTSVLAQANATPQNVLALLR